MRRNLTRPEVCWDTLAGVQTLLAMSKYMLRVPTVRSVPTSFSPHRRFFDRSSSLSELEEELEPELLLRDRDRDLDLDLSRHVQFLVD